MMCNYFRFGGVAFDLPPGWIERCRGDGATTASTARSTSSTGYLSGNEIVLDRCKGVGVLTRGPTRSTCRPAGPVLRASGVSSTTSAAPRLTRIYDRFEFEVVSTGSNGDLYDRYPRPPPARCERA